MNRLSPIFITETGEHERQAGYPETVQLTEQAPEISPAEHAALDLLDLQAEIDEAMEDVSVLQDAILETLDAINTQLDQLERLLEIYDPAEAERCRRERAEIAELYDRATATRQ